MCAHREEGWCLTEVALAFGIGACVLAGSLAALNTVHVQSLYQQRSLAGLQDMRMGLEVFEQEARLAAVSGLTVASADRLEFTANLHAMTTMTTGAVEPGQSLLSVQDGSGWGKGKTVRLCGAAGCETHRLVENGRKTQLVLAEPVARLFPAGASVEVMNRVVYYTRTDAGGERQVMRMIDGGAGVLIGGLRDAQWSYWDEQGRPAGRLDRIARVVLALEMAEPAVTIAREVSVRS